MADQLVFVTVNEKNVGDLEMAFDGKEFVDSAIVLECTMVDVASREKRAVTLIIPKSCGADLLVNLLTDDQWEAVTNA